METVTRTPRKTSKLLELLKIKSKYKILLDESISFTPRPEREDEIVWCEFIPAYKGMIYLSGASPLELAFFSESIRKINSTEKVLKDKVRVVKLDGEGIIFFNAKDFKEVAKLAGAKRGRKLSEEHKQKLLASRNKNKEEK
jgi:hypothetical protein